MEAEITRTICAEAFTLMREKWGSRDAAALPAPVLAYLGDAIYELYVRRRLVSCGYLKVDALHKHAVRFVNAATQAKVLHAVAGELTEDEAAVVKRGRNAKSGSVPKNISVTDYRHGTAFEALIGYLYLAGREERIGHIFDIACRIVMSTEEGNNNESKTH